MVNSSGHHAAASWRREVEVGDDGFGSSCRCHRESVNATPKTTNNRCGCTQSSTDPAARPSYSLGRKDLFKEHSSQLQPGVLAHGF